MTIGTLLRYLIGNRQAIMDIANCPLALGVGLLFVLSAGFAREYDGEDLWAEPWHLLIPVAASIVTSLILFLLAFTKFLAQDSPPPRFFTAYRAFLALYWMTAPLAWLYAIPYERLLPAPQAVEANLWTLALVAAWRVVLMIRVVSVLMGYRILEAVVLVLLFADGVALTALAFMPLPVVSFMGGVRLSESDRVIRNVTCFIQCWGALLLPVCIVFTLITFVTAKPSWQLASAGVRSRFQTSRSLWVMSLVSVLVWTAVLPFTQPEQRLRRTVEQTLRAGQLQGGLDMMLSHDRGDFPPHWDPPPRIGYADQRPPLLDIAELIDEKSESWVRDVYVEKLRLAFGRGYYTPGDGGLGTVRLVRLAARFGIEADVDDYAIEDMLRIVDSANNLTETERAETKAVIERWNKQRKHSR